jgi:hypothetical protein
MLKKAWANGPPFAAPLLRRWKRRRQRCDFTTTQWVFLVFVAFVAGMFVVSFVRIEQNTSFAEPAEREALLSTLVFLGGVPLSGTSTVNAFICKHAHVACWEQERKEGSHATLPEIAEDFHATTTEGDRLDRLVARMLDPSQLHEWTLADAHTLLTTQHKMDVVDQWRAQLQVEYHTAFPSDEHGFDGQAQLLYMHRHHPHLGRIPFLNSLFGAQTRFITVIRHPGHFAAYQQDGGLPRLEGWLQLHEMALAHTRALGEERGLFIRIEEFTRAPECNAVLLMRWLGVGDSDRVVQTTGSHVQRLRGLQQVPYPQGMGGPDQHQRVNNQAEEDMTIFAERLVEFGYDLWPSADVASRSKLCPPFDLCHLGDMRQQDTEEAKADVATAPAPAGGESGNRVGGGPKIVGRVLDTNELPCFLDNSHARLISRTVLMGGAHASGTTISERLVKMHPDVAGLVDTHRPYNEGQHVQSVIPSVMKLRKMKKKVLNHKDDFENSLYNDEWVDMTLPQQYHLLVQENAAKVTKSWAQFLQSNHPHAKVIINKSPPNLAQISFLNFFFFNAPRFVMILRAPTRYNEKVDSIEPWLVTTEHARHSAFSIGGAERVVFVRIELFTADIHKWLRVLFGYLQLDPDKFDWSLVVQLPRGAEAELVAAKRDLLWGVHVFDGVTQVPEGSVGVLPVGMKQRAIKVSLEQEARLNVLGYSIIDGMQLLEGSCPEMDLCRCE